MRGIVCAAALIFIACALDASALSSASYGDIDIAIDSAVKNKTTHGYASYSVQVQNRSPDKTRRVKIRIEPEPAPSTGHEEGRLKSLTRTIEAAPNATVQTYIRQPHLNLNGQRYMAAVWIDGQKQTKALRLAASSRMDYYRKDPAVAMDDIRKRFLPPYAKLLGVMRRRDLETNALIYGSLDGIILPLDEAEALSGAGREALWDYVKSGGSLAVMGDGKLSDEWKRLGARLENPIPNNSEIARYDIGFGQLFLAQPPPHRGSTRFQLYDSWKKTQQPWNATYSSSGANAALPVAEPYDPLANYRRMFFLMLLLAVLIGPVNIFLLRQKNRRMKLYWTVPAVSLLACVLVTFYAATADGGKRMRVCSLTYLDQGAGSATTIGGIGFYSPSAHPDGLLFDEETELTLQASPKDGGGTSGMFKITVAFTSSSPVSGAPTTPSTGSVPLSGFFTGAANAWTSMFRPKPAAPTSGTTTKPTTGSTTTGTTWTTTIRPKPTAPTSWTTTMPVVTTPSAGFSSSTTPIHAYDADDHAVGSIDWTDGQRWSGEWIKPRMPLHFKFRKTEERNERIELKRNGGKLKVVNRLGADVKAFWYADHDGKLYQASDIRNGAAAVLTETKGVSMGGKTLRQLYTSQDWVPEIEAAQKSPAAYLQPGRYIAEPEENVFVEKAMKGAKMKASTCLVVGELEQGE